MHLPDNVPDLETLNKEINKEISFIGLHELQYFCKKEIPHSNNAEVQAEKFLIIGWRRDLRDVLVALDEIVGPGTSVHLFDELSEEARNDSLSESGDFDAGSLRHITLVHHYGNPVSRRDLVKLHEELNLLNLSTIFITAGEKNESNTHTSDSKNIATLLLIRNIQSAWIKGENLQHKKKHKIHSPAAGRKRSITSSKMNRKNLESAKNLSKMVENTQDAHRHVSSKIFPKDKKEQDERALSFDETAIPTKHKIHSPVDKKQREVLSRRMKRMQNSITATSSNLFRKKDRGIIQDLEMVEDAENVGHLAFAADMNLCITEILDTRTQRMISSNPLLVASSDYLQTNEMASRVLAQVVVRKELKNVFDELLGPAGNSLYLRPAMDYLHDNEYDSVFPHTQCTCFMGLSRRTFLKGEILVGYKERDKKPVVNPKDKLLVDKRIKWTTTELIVMRKSKDKVSRTQGGAGLAAQLAPELTGVPDSTVSEGVKEKATPTQASNEVMAILEEQRKER